jgi:hypothetical protein
MPRNMGKGTGVPSYKASFSTLSLKKSAVTGLGLMTLGCSYFLRVTFFVASLLCMEGALGSTFSDDVQRLVRDSRELKEELYSIEVRGELDRPVEARPFARSLNERAERLVNDALRVLPQFEIELQERVKVLSSPQVEKFLALKTDFLSDLNAIANSWDKVGSLTRKDTPAERDVQALTYQKILALSRIGQFQEVTPLFELLAARLTWASIFLTALHVRTVTSLPLPGLDWPAYLNARDMLEQGLISVRAFLPSLPELSFGYLNTPPGQNELWDFINLFRPFDGNFRDTDKSLRRSVAEMQRAVLEFDAYRRRQFPVMERDAVLRHLQAQFFDLPGMSDCLDLASRSSAFGSSVCARPYSFYEYAELFRQQVDQTADHGLTSMIKDQVKKYRPRIHTEKSDAVWMEFSQSLKDLLNGTNVTQELKEKWPKVVDLLLLPAGTSGERSLRTLIEQGASGADLLELIEDVLAKYEIQFPLNQKGALESYDDYRPSAEAVNVIQNTFHSSVVEPLADSSLPGKEVLERLRYLETNQKIVSPSPSAESCALYHANLTEEEKIAKSDWAVVPDYIAGKRVEPPQVEAGINGGQHMIWVRPAKLSNLFASQYYDRPRQMFAGIVKLTTRNTMLTNYVHALSITRSWSRNNVEEARHLEDFGFQESRLSFVEAAVKTFGFPKSETIIGLGRSSFREMLSRWVDRNKSRLVEFNSKDLPTLSAEEFDAIFEKNYDQFLNAYVDNQRTDMAVGAEAIRKWMKRWRRAQAAEFKAGETVEVVLGKKERRYGLDPETIPKELVVGAADWDWERILVDFKLRYLKRLKNQQTGVSKGARKISRDELVNERFPAADFVWYYENFGLKYSGNQTVHDRLVRYFKGQLEQLEQQAKTDHGRVREVYEAARDLLFYRFPALLLGDAWQWYEGKPEQFQKVMNLYTENIAKELKRMLALGEGRTGLDKNVRWALRMEQTLPDKEAAEVILEDVRKNRPLLHLLVKGWGNFHSVVCDLLSEEASHEWWVENRSYAANAAMILLLPTAFAPMGVAGLGLIAVARWTRTAQAYQILDDLKSEFLAMAAQGNSADLNENLDFWREKNDEANGFFNLAVIETAFFLIPFGKPAQLWSQTKNIATSVRLGTGLRGFGATARYFARLPLNLVKGLGQQGAYDEIARPLEGWLIRRHAEQATLLVRLLPSQMRAAARSSPALTRNLLRRAAINLRGVRNLPQQPLNVLSRLFPSYWKTLLTSRGGQELMMVAASQQPVMLLEMEFLRLAINPWLVLGYEWTPLAGKIVIGTGLVAIPSTVMILEALRDKEIEDVARVMELVALRPQRYERILKLWRGGKVSFEKFKAALEMDPELSEVFFISGQETIKRIEEEEALAKKGDAGAPGRIQGLEAKLEDSRKRMEFDMDNERKSNGESARYYAHWFRYGELVEMIRDYKNPVIPAR